MMAIDEGPQLWSSTSEEATLALCRVWQHMPFAFYTQAQQRRV